MRDKPLGADQRALINAILEFDEDTVTAQVQSLLKAGNNPLQIAEVARQAMDKVGQMFQNKEIFLTELIMAGELLKGVMELRRFTPEKMAQV